MRNAMSSSSPSVVDSLLQGSLPPSPQQPHPSPTSFLASFLAMHPPATPSTPPVVTQSQETFPVAIDLQRFLQRTRGSPPSYSESETMASVLDTPPAVTTVVRNRKGQVVRSCLKCSPTIPRRQVTAHHFTFLNNQRSPSPSTTPPSTPPPTPGTASPPGTGLQRRRSSAASVALKHLKQQQQLQQLQENGTVPSDPVTPEKTLGTLLLEAKKRHLTFGNTLERVCLFERGSLVTDISGFTHYSVQDTGDVHAGSLSASLALKETWMIASSNAPTVPSFGNLPVALDCVSLEEGRVLVGSILVRNLDFGKSVTVRYTIDGWTTSSDVRATFGNVVSRNTWEFQGMDRFVFRIELNREFATDAQYAHLQFAVKYEVLGQTHWDNNEGNNYQVDFCRPTAQQAGFVTSAAAEQVEEPKVLVTTTTPEKQEKPLVYQPQPIAYCWERPMPVRVRAASTTPSTRRPYYFQQPPCAIPLAVPSAFIISPQDSTQQQRKPVRSAPIPIRKPPVDPTTLPYSPHHHGGSAFAPITFSRQPIPSTITSDNTFTLNPLATGVGMTPAQRRESRRAVSLAKAAAANETSTTTSAAPPYEKTESIPIPKSIRRSSSITSFSEGIEMPFSTSPLEVLASLGHRKTYTTSRLYADGSDSYSNSYGCSPPTTFAACRA